jgi:hypothetical protein
MSKRMRNLLSAASRQTSVAGFITWDKSEFGERIAFYNDLPILVTDYDDKNAQVIDFNEANAPAAARRSVRPSTWSPSATAA